MSRTTWVNTGAVALALVVASVLSLVGPSSETTARRDARRFRLELELTTTEDGRAALVDATGAAIPLGDYQRIVSGSSVVDHLLLEMCEPDRVVAFTQHTATHPRYGHKVAGKPTLTGITALEEVLALAPDLLIVNNVFHDASPVTRLRDAGLTVFDLGEMRGLETLLPNIHAVAHLIGEPERAIDVEERFLRRFRGLAASVPPAERKRGMYLSLYGELIYGGTLGTSFHDVLTHAGLVDIAADRYTGWPRYTTEEVVNLDPAVIVTREGMERAICRHPGLQVLAACAPGGHIVEVTSGTIESPGLQMLDAAEEIFAALYGQE